MKSKQPSKPAAPMPLTNAERREQQRKDFSKRVDAEKRGRKP
jgi:hypothetical protein